MAFTRNWSESTPLGTENASLADDYIRYSKVDVSDRLKNMIYGFISGENTLLQHFQYVQFYEQAALAQPSAGYGRVGCLAVGGKCELHYRDEDNNLIQLTTAGAIGGANLQLLAGKDLLGSATSDITINTDKFTVAGATGNTVIAGTLALTGLATLTGGLTSPAAITSTLSTGTAPFTVSSTTKVTNLNADKVDGYDISAYSGGESYTFPGGLVIKMGIATSVTGTGTKAVTFGAAFGTACICAVVTAKTTVAITSPASLDAYSTTGLTVRNNDGTARDVHWTAIGY